jgi:hypothetical protein
MTALLKPMRRPMISTIGVMQFVVQLAQEIMAGVSERFGQAIARGT